MENQIKEVSSDPPTAIKRKYYIERSLDRNEKSKNVEGAMDLLMAWPNWQIWPFKVSVPVVTIAAMVPGFILNTAFRNALLLGHYGKVSSYLATMGLPGVITATAHSQLVSSDILEQRTLCPVCVQVRSAAIQSFTGFLYPAIITPLVCFPIATRMKTLYFPKIHKQPKEVLSFALEVFKSVKTRYIAFGMFQIVTAMGAAYFQQNCFFNILLPVLKGENKFDKESQKREIYR